MSTTHTADVWGALLVWCLIAALLALSIALVLANKRQADEPETVELDEVADALVWCEGCNCKHHLRWMRWTPEGLFRCTVCCRTNTTARNR